MVHIQKSFNNQQASLYIVPTPIGNLEDITLRALRILKEVDLVACEDTRQTGKLLQHFEIKQKLFSYHDHSSVEKTAQLLDTVENGESVALVSDAGMPLISDPGTQLVAQARERDLPVVVLPGANAALTALVGSGMDAYQFYFYGFLPRKKKDLQQVLTELDQTKQTLVFYESPHRIKKTIASMREVYSTDRKVSLARELTKKFEEFIYGSIEEVDTYCQSESAELRGEFCIIIEPFQGEINNYEEWWKEYSLKEHVDYYIERDGMKMKAAVKLVAEDRNVKSRDVYQEYHEE
ncbi:16S rRNA (cytidine(1402)-2'-O)-methyltransferase [Halalkalibacillus halophilus]|uniref:16S rRNA (cytidine(1402)-2'-O)-methyltransferase n=1 Tax=Halalkalibacillus halophilus TaxID=392827 RepID=UPI0004106955